jgi:hypothetical protein
MSVMYRCFEFSGRIIRWNIVYELNLGIEWPARCTWFVPGTFDDNGLVLDEFYY